MSHPEVREVSNYREIFERLSKCNLPAGITVVHAWWGLKFYDAERKHLFTVAHSSTLAECRAALMLIVDQLERQGGAFVRTYAASLDSPELVYTWNGSIADGKWSRWRDKDEVIALASCLIQVLGGELPE